MKVSFSKLFGIVSAMLGILTITGVSFAQSRDPNFPTAVTSNEVNGTIQARDLGDSRLTTYYYALEGSQGDIFVNVVTKNFSGDIDVFSREGLRPLSKMVIYADAGVNETGRLIYLRKEAKLLLRVQGRTPNDDAATFRIKFGGSFVAIKGGLEEAAPVIDSGGERSGIAVNSVGTIVEVKPKPLPINEIPPIVEKVPEQKETEPQTRDPEPTEKEEVPAKATGKPEVVVESLLKEPVTIPSPKPKKAVSTRKVAAKPVKKVVAAEKKPDPMEGIRLMILMKDGTQIERPMTEVLRFSVDKGVLTVISKNGAVAKYSILDVAKVTIE